MVMAKGWRRFWRWLFPGCRSDTIDVDEQIGLASGGFVFDISGVDSTESPERPSEF